MDELTDALRDEINVPSGDDDRIARVLVNARSYVLSATGSHSVPDTVFDDCVITVVGFKRIRMKHHSHRFGGAALLTQHIDGFGHVN